MKTLKMVNALAVALVAGLVFGGSAGEAQAKYISMPTNGTQSCRATNAAGAGNFYYNHTYLWNGGTTNQYLTCVLPEWNLQESGMTTNVSMAWASSGTPGKVTCTAQMGSFYQGANHIDQGATASLTLDAGSHGYIQFYSLVPTATWSMINMICSVPPGFKLGLIERYRVVPDTW